MSEKRTKSDKWLRQAEKLEKKTEQRPEPETGKPKVREDLNRAA